MKLNVWQAEAIATAMREHDDATSDPTSDLGGLDRAYADVQVRDAVETEDHDRVIVIAWEDGVVLRLGDSCANAFVPTEDD